MIIYLNVFKRYNCFVKPSDHRDAHKCIYAAYRDFQSVLDGDSHVRRPVRYLRNLRILEDVQREFDRHGSRDDFFKLLQNWVSDGGDM